MIEFETHESVDGAEWDRWLSSCPTARVYQSSAWLRFLNASQTGRPVWARIRKDGKPIGCFAGRVVRRLGLDILGSPLPGWTTLYMGPALQEREEADGELSRALDRWVFETLRCSHFEMLSTELPADTMQVLGYRHEILPSFLVDLSVDEAVLFRSFNKGCKWSIHKAEKEGLRVEMGRQEDFARDYYEQLGDVFAKQGLVPTYPPSRVDVLLDAVPEEQLLCFRVRTRNGKCAATGLIAIDRSCGYLWGAASWREYQKLCPNELLQWHVMLELKRRGIHRYDFGGGGEYKAKYGGARIQTPWFHKSRSSVLTVLRDLYRGAFRARQRIRGLGRGRLRR